MSSMLMFLGAEITESDREALKLTELMGVGMKVLNTGGVLL